MLEPLENPFGPKVLPSLRYAVLSPMCPGRTQKPLTSEDRRLLLGASLRVLGHRFICGKTIFKDDVIRVVSLADDATCVTTNR